MHESQIKTRIFLIRTVDFAFLIAVFSLGYYSVRYSEQGAIMGAVTLFGLFLVNRLGNYSSARIASLRLQMKKLEKEKKDALRRQG